MPVKKVATKKPAKKKVTKKSKISQDWSDGVQAKVASKISKNIHELLALYPAKEYLEKQDDIDVPLHLRGGEFRWNFEKKTPLVDKILWVLAVVEVAILISLIVKNI